MSWLRLDDGFTSHPKFEGWNAAEKWAFLELMEYCARYRTGGRVPSDLALLPRSVTAKVVYRAEDAGWLERRDGALFVHDWDIYNPRDATGAERQRRYRERHENRDEDRNENVTSRARQRGRPVPSHTTTPKDSGSEGVIVKGKDVKGVPENKNESNPVAAKLVDHVRGIDNDERRRFADTVYAYARRLPEGCFARALESLDYRRRSGEPLDSEAGYVVATLATMHAEGRPA